ncbi:MAG: putative toxin-antitoxin system toxin component, PIN family [Verrucomicrobia bacterium]|nr:putative toxin-antitoxin system toxin component, PIN family [Verrucomicrobiota bacterium]
MRAVVDNNLFVSGLLWGDQPGRLFSALAVGRLEIFLSEALLAELREVLQRRKFAARLALKGLTPKIVLAQVQAAARVVHAPPIPLPASLRDADDVPVLACAVSADVDVIITGDKDLLALKAFSGIPILTVRQALEKLGIPAD